MTRATAKIAVAVLAAAAGTTGVLLARGRATGPPEAPSVPTGTAAVRRVDVAERRQVSGALGYAGTVTVIASGGGLLTRVPALGTVVGRGQPMYEIDGTPVLLLYGERPTWRALHNGVPDGADVEQLEANLRDLGHGAGVTVDRHFDAATSTAIRRFQRVRGLPVTGTVPLGQVVFLPGPVRVSAHDLQPGTPVEPGAVVGHGTGDQPAVTARVSPQQLTGVEPGTAVVVTLPDGSTRPGVVTALGTVAQQTTDGATLLLTVRLDGTVTGILDLSTVRIAITVRRHDGVLAVPITALNAVPGGGYEVVVDGAGRVRVTTGLFDEFAGLAEITGAGLTEGDLVRVPRDDA